MKKIAIYLFFICIFVGAPFIFFQVLSDITAICVLSFIFFTCAILLIWACFNEYTRRYPLNSVEDYQINIKKLLRKNSSVKVVVEEANKGIWLVKTDYQSMCFDLRGYIFAKCYISAFFVRNINYLVINKNNLRAHKMCCSLKLRSEDSVDDFILEFRYKNKIKQTNIIKNKKTKSSFLIYMIIASKFFLGKSGRIESSKITKLSDEYYYKEYKKYKKESVLKKYIEKN